MKKIIVIASVKNESDIIESFCRYNLSFCDRMLIHENHKSSDGTRDIITRLIDEGLPIAFEAEEDMHYETAKNVLAGIAVQSYGADLVVQLDADEFLCHREGVNPRGVLENLDEHVELHVPWRTYVYQGEQPADGGCAFVPDAFTHYRNPALEDMQGHAGKAVASRFLLCSKKARFGYGGHWLEYPDGQVPAETALSDVLFCAHYPVRSRLQVMCKAIPNWINKWTLPEPERPSIDSLTKFQLGILFFHVREHGYVSDDMLRDLSVTYSLYNRGDRVAVDNMIRGLGDGLLAEGAADTAFCTDLLSLRYTTVPHGGADGDCSALSDKFFLRSTLSVLADALVNLDSESRSKSPLVLERELLLQECSNLRLRIDNIFASSTWKIGFRIVSFLRFFVPGKRKREGWDVY